MTSKALGLIETIGLAAALEAADTAIKTADVKLLGYENVKGGGRITIKFVGDVGAVKAAVASGSAAALRIGKVESCLIIPRPHAEIEALINQIDRGRSTPSAVPQTAPIKASEPQAVAQKPKPAALKKAKQRPAAPRLEIPEPVAPPPVEEQPPVEIVSPPALSDADQPPTVTPDQPEQPDDIS
ncbi:MAG: BMC domain-containing protein [Anaerolineales bacterium]|nr:BMC domain-containing protein [Anaerolineales bacterium]